jgi:hypothetical protein
MRHCRSLESGDPTSGPHKWAVCLTATVLATGAHAQGYESEARALRQCYDTAAAYYGARTCDPPASLLGAIFGRCTREEFALRRAIQKTQRGYDDATIDAGIFKSQKDRSHHLQSIVMDARIEAGKTCP